MQEHPVPQNVTGYEFHLIGQMTLKQFFTAGAGVLLAVITNATNLPEIFKYPLMLLFGLGGFALAFVPYEGRSLDRWFFAFISSIYKPTLFFWKKTNPVPEPFTYVQPRFLDTTPTVDYTGVRTQRATEFLRTIPRSHVITEEPEEDISGILALFSQPIPGEKQPLSSSQPTIPIYQHPVKEIVIKPAGEKLAVEKQILPQKKESAVPITALKAVEIRSETKQQADITKPTATSAGLPFPKPPTKPNMLVGMVFSQDNKIIGNAIVEIIRRADGVPVRALKTNALGQFAIITPLENGEYEMNVEKDGYSFDKTLLVLNNEVVQPLLIQAK